MDPLKPLSPDDKTSSFLTLPNGRRIGYSLHGPDNGTPIISLHGTPGSRLDALHYAPFAEQLGCRLIGIDRPCIGLSSHVPASARRLCDYPSDVLALADHLNLSNFRVLGVSGGGPYALACAAAIPPERLLATSVVVGLGPLDQGRHGMSWVQYIKWRLVRWIPWAARWVTRRDIGDGSEAAMERHLEKSLAGLSPSDREIVTRPSWWRPALLSQTESARYGVDGFVEDLLMLARPWDFDLRDVRGGRVLLWYAGQDPFVGTGPGQWIKDRLENAELTVVEDATHISMVGQYRREIFEQMLSTS